MDNEKSNDTLLEEELKRHLDALDGVAIGSNESKAILDDMNEVAKILAERKKLEIEANKHKADHELEVKKHEDEQVLEAKKLEREQAKLKAEQEAREQDRKEAKKQRWTSAILQGMGFGVTFGLAAMDKRSIGKLLGTVLKFEETGNYVSSSAGKSLLGSIFRIKK